MTRAHFTAPNSSVKEIDDLTDLAEAVQKYHNLEVHDSNVQVDDDYFSRLEVVLTNCLETSLTWS